MREWGRTISRWIADRTCLSIHPSIHPSGTYTRFQLSSRANSRRRRFVWIVCGCRPQSALYHAKTYEASNQSKPPLPTQNVRGYQFRSTNSENVPHRNNYIFSCDYERIMRPMFETRMMYIHV